MPGSEERALVFNEPAIQRDTKRGTDIYKVSMREASQEAEERRNLCKDCSVITKVLTWRLFLSYFFKNERDFVRQIKKGPSGMWKYYGEVYGNFEKRELVGTIRL